MSIFKQFFSSIVDATSKLKRDISSCRRNKTKKSKKIKRKMLKK